MTDQTPQDAGRKLVWERIKKAAQDHHDHHKDRGINKIIAIDAGVSDQYVSDWKNGRSPVPMATIAKLASAYSVSAGYIAGFTDDPTQTAPTSKAALRAEMVRLVEDVLRRLKPNADPFLVVELCDMALDMLQEGEKETSIIGALYKRLGEEDSDPSTK